VPDGYNGMYNVYDALPLTAFPLFPPDSDAGGKRYLTCGRPFGRLVFWLNILAGEGAKMRNRVRTFLVVGLTGAVLVLSTGCLFNIFQTAKTIGAGNVALTIGSGLFDFNLLDTDSSYYLTPQARLTIGLADSVDLGFQTGLLMSLEGEDVGWCGATGDLKFALFDEPDSFALALGFGGGYSLETLGWEAFGEVFFDSNVKFLPIFVAYQPHVALVEGFALIHHFAGGLKLRLSDKARLLFQGDYNSYGYVSYGLALEVVF